jgi:alanyl-tRNA synthetase
VGVPPAGSGILPERTFETEHASGARKTATQDASLGGQDAHPTRGATYTRRRRLPHFEQPWAIYALTISTAGRRKLSPAARTIVLDALRHFHRSRYELFAACVMPDHVHVLLQPWVKGHDDRGEAVFWPLGDLMHSIKSFTAKEMNKAEGTTGTVWEQERFDRYVRGDRDLEEKFFYILDNPAREGLGDEYPWVWSLEGSEDRSGETPEPAGGTPTLPETSAPRVIPGEFAFTLYDTYGFPLDLTELMARERGLTVDTAGFETHMEEQRARARAAQKKTIIELSEVETKTPTHFLGYDHDHTGADVQEVLSVKGRTVIITNNSVCYAEMGGQVGDTGEMTHGGNSWRITNTQKSGHTWLHFLDEADAPASGRVGVPPAGLGVPPERTSDIGDASRDARKAATQDASLGGQDAHPTRDADAPAPGDHVTISIDRTRRGAIQRHHTVTHLLHWALHEVVSHEATQKGSFVGPDKLTFDFNSAALTPAQVRDIERLVNERIVENAAVSWIEVPYADVRGRGDIMQFFGDKYGETVRVVQIGGAPRTLDGYSQELCAGTHTRATGEIGLFRIASEAAIAAGVRRIEAQAGLHAYDLATSDTQRLHALATKLGTPLPELEKRIEGMLAQQKELEKSLKAASQREAAGRAKDLLASAQIINGTPAIIANLGAADGDTLQTVADALKSHGFQGVTVLGGSANGAVALVAAVSPDFTAKVQAGKIISAIAPLVGGKGGGKPEGARGGGKDPTQLDAALAKAREMLG